MAVLLEETTCSFSVMGNAAPPVDAEHRVQEGSGERPDRPDPTIVQSPQGVPIDFELPTSSGQLRPELLKAVSTPTYDSPLRHHKRGPSAPRQVKESLNARSEYVTSQDDGSAQHRINQYIILQEIGRGSFGAVHLARDQYGEEYAVKEFSKSRLRKRAQSHILRAPKSHRQKGNLALEDFNSPLHRNAANDPAAANEINAIDLIREEIAIMKKLNHPNLVSLIEVLDDPREDSLYMVLEMCKKGVVMKVGLGETADPYSEEQCRCWFRDLILGIEYLHAQGIVHRDIKPDNCLLTNDDVLKVVDFGVSEMFEKDSEMVVAKSAGSPAFLPPELCVVKHGGISGRAADIWSMGITLYCLRYGRIPFERSRILELYESIRKDQLFLPAECDDSFRDLMIKLLDKNPERRIKLAQLREHPWVTRDGTDPLLSASDNTAELVEPPTEKELNRAITGKINNLLIVMKAVQKFKKLLDNKRPPNMSTVLDDERTSQLTQTPTNMSFENSATPRFYEKSHSVDADDRRPLQGALATEGVHKKIDFALPVRGGRHSNDRNLGSVSSSDAAASKGQTSLDHSAPPPSYETVELSSASRRALDDDEQQFPPFTRTTVSPPLDLVMDPIRRTQTLDESGHRGHAHDPLEDHLYLYVGPSTFSGINEATDRDMSFVGEDEYIVSESPGAADIDIYETAYRDEIEKIRARLLDEGKEGDESEPVIYLTRRVDARLMALGGLAGRVMAYGEEGLERIKDFRHLREGRAKVTGVSRALRAAALEEYERRKQERRARETVETAKAEMNRSRASGSGPSGENLESGESPGSDTAKREQQSTSPRSQSSLFSQVSPLAGKAWEKGQHAWEKGGQQAKSSFKGLYGKAWKQRTSDGSGN